MTDSEWLTLKARMLYESGMTLREMKPFVGGISAQALSFRLKKIGYRSRGIGRPKRQRQQPGWQKSLIRKVKSLGLSNRDTAYLLSLPIGTIGKLTGGLTGSSGGGKKSESQFKTTVAYHAWIEARNNILFSARADGATFQEISDLAGFKKAEIPLIILRRMGLPRTES